MSKKTLLRSVSGTLMLLTLLATGNAKANDMADEIMIADAQRLETAEMDELRGGFTDPSGLLLGFAVDVNTLVDGSLMFTRSFVVEPDSNGQLQASNNTQLMQGGVPGNMQASLINDGKGVLLTNGQGDTRMINQTENGMFTNIVTNTADNRNVVQNMNIDITLRNLAGVTGALGGIGPAVAGGVTSLMQSARTHALGLTQ